MRNQRLGAWRARWGSLARKGLPVVVRLPETTQLLLASMKRGGAIRRRALGASSRLRGSLRSSAERMVGASSG